MNVYFQHSGHSIIFFKFGIVHLFYAFEAGGEICFRLPTKPKKYLISFLELGHAFADHCNLK